MGLPTSEPLRDLDSFSVIVLQQMVMGEYGRADVERGLVITTLFSAARESRWLSVESNLAVGQHGCVLNQEARCCCQ